MQSLGRKLQALQYPNAESFDPQDAKQFHVLVFWLENRKIRQLDVEARAGLRTLDGSWGGAFSAYLNELQIGCDQFDFSAATSDAKVVVLDRLLSHAVALEYDDAAEELRHTTHSTAVAAAEEEVVVRATMTVDAESPEFFAAIDAFATKLGLPPHEDKSVQLQVRLLGVCLKLSRRSHLL